MTNLDFSNLQTLDPAGRKAWFELPIPWDPVPRLLLSHAGSTNKPYALAIARANAKGARQNTESAEGQIRALEHNLELDRTLFPVHVITGWEGIRDATGELVPFSPDVCKDFLRKLPDWLVQRISRFASIPSNFLPEGTPTDAEVDAQAGE